MNIREEIKKLSLIVMIEIRRLDQKGKHTLNLQVHNGRNKILSVGKQHIESVDIELTKEQDEILLGEFNHIRIAIDENFKEIVSDRPFYLSGGSDKKLTLTKWYNDDLVELKEELTKKQFKDLELANEETNKTCRYGGYIIRSASKVYDNGKTYIHLNTQGTTLLLKEEEIDEELILKTLKEVIDNYNYE